MVEHDLTRHRLTTDGQAVVERHAAGRAAEQSLIGLRGHRPNGGLRESGGPHEPRSLIVSHQVGPPSLPWPTGRPSETAHERHH